jgi:hypothetical protein|eukprot:COSAG06_NODE_1512_length_9233_cov_2.774141_4_plen_377_part_00
MAARADDTRSAGSGRARRLAGLGVDIEPDRVCHFLAEGVSSEGVADSLTTAVAAAPSAQPYVIIQKDSLLSARSLPLPNEWELLKEFRRPTLRLVPVCPVLPKRTAVGPAFRKSQVHRRAGPLGRAHARPRDCASARKPSTSSDRSLGQSCSRSHTLPQTDQLRERVLCDEPLELRKQDEDGCQCNDASAQEVEPLLLGPPRTPEIARGRKARSAPSPGAIKATWSLQVGVLVHSAHLHHRDQPAPTEAAAAAAAPEEAVAAAAAVAAAVYSPPMSRWAVSSTRPRQSKRSSCGSSFIAGLRPKGLASSLSSGSALKASRGMLPIPWAPRCETTTCTRGIHPDTASSASRCSAVGTGASSAIVHGHQPAAWDLTER